MRIHSDTLTGSDLSAALGEAGLHDVTAEYMQHGSRKRDHAFEVRLEAAPRKGRRARNTGTHGAEQSGGYVAAATYDEHGRWMARLFEIDPDAIVTYYHGRDDFHRQTHGRYAQHSSVWARAEAVAS